MKTIIETNTSTRTKDNLNINHVLTLVIEFLIRNGMGRAHTESAVSLHDEDRTIKMDFDCANMEYTKAISLLTLLSTINDSGFYIAFKLIKEEGFMTLYVKCFNNCIDTLTHNYKITIED